MGKKDLHSKVVKVCAESLMASTCDAIEWEDVVYVSNCVAKAVVHELIGSEEKTFCIPVEVTR